MELYGKNKSTSEYFTKLEREHLVKQYNDKCNKPNENLIKCCDANDNRINNVDNYIDEKLKNKFSKIKINRDREGIIESIYVCNPLGIKEQEENAENESYSENMKCDGYTKPTNYELCKLLNANVVNGKVNNILPDCYQNKCYPSKSDVFMSVYGNKNNRFEDIELVNTILLDNVSSLKDRLNKSINIGGNNLSFSNRLNRILTHDDSGNTLIHETIKHNARKCFSYIISQKGSRTIDLDIKNVNGNTPLGLGCFYKNDYCVHFLIKQGAIIWMKNNMGDTPLHISILVGSLEITKTLINVGVNISDINNYSETPLHTAVRCNNPKLEIIRLLVDKGSDLLTKNIKNESLLKTLENNKSTNRTVLEEIRTYLQNQYYIRFSKGDDITDEEELITNKRFRIEEPESYDKLIKDYPEISPYKTDYADVVDVDVDTEVEVEDEDESKDNYDNVILDYDNKISDQALYRDRQTNPYKANYKGNIDTDIGQTIVNV